MKKVFVIFSLIVSATCFAFDGPPINTDWAVATKLDDGSLQVYEVFPNTADVKTVNDMVVSTSVVRIVNIERNIQAVRRILVVGCDEGAGKTTLVETNGNEIAGLQIFDWSKDGDRVFDKMASLTCVAVIMSQARPVEPAKTPVPHKLTSPGLTV